MTPGLAVRRTPDRQEMLAVAEPLEPQSSLIVARLSEPGSRRRTRVWTVEHADGRPAAILVVWRLCLDRWYASPLILEEPAAELLAPLIDASPALGVFGPDEHVRPLCGRLARSSRVSTMPWGWTPAPIRPPAGPLDPRTRVATAGDLDALVELYRWLELYPIPTVPRLRHFLRGVLRHGTVILAEDQGRVVAAIRAEARTGRYLYWSGSTVLPELRGGGLVRAIMNRAQSVNAESGLGGFAIRRTHGRSGVRAPLRAVVDPAHREGTTIGTWTSIALRTPVRFRGQGHLRRAAERVEGRLDRRAGSHLTPER